MMDNQDALQEEVHPVLLGTVPTVHQLGRHPTAERYWPMSGWQKHQMLKRAEEKYHQMSPSWTKKKISQDIGFFRTTVVERVEKESIVVKS